MLLTPSPPRPALSPARRIELPRVPEAVAEARAFIAEGFRAHLSDDALSDTYLVVSELVTNALVHGAGRVVLEVRLHDEALHVGVIDEGTGAAPGIREQGAEDGGGWGLRLVDSLSRDWGAFEGTTHVWAELRTS